jgi:signal transduction histidine kinase
VEETVELFSKEPRVSKQCQIETFINKGIEIQGDPVRLKQALWNLLSNALDAGDSGARIRITLETNPEKKLAVLKVQDWGSGIPYEIRNRLFEPFTTTKDKGTGLGLAVVMGIAESHGGSIDVESSPEGTTFTITLPLHISDPN